jgi:PAS domain S-box-containing protein
LLPSLFKERLFVHLSRFCAVRYCIVRHVGFLIGLGRPAGDASALPETIEQAIALLTRPARCATALEQALARLEAVIGAANIPAPRTELESDLFDALTSIFLEPRLSERARDAVRYAFGRQTFEILVAYLAFIRTAHYWTETHPELGYEPDIAAVLQRHPALAAILLDQTEAKRAAEGEVLRQALAELVQAKHALGHSKTLQAFLLKLSDALRPLGDALEIQRVTCRALREHLGAGREAALRQSEECLRLAQLRTGVGIWDSNLGTGKLTWTPQLEAIFGLERETVKCYADFRDRVHPDDIARIEAKRDVALRRRETFNVEFRIIRPEGQVRWLLATGGACYDAAPGEPTRIVGNSVDITERKEVEEKLQKSEQLFRELLEALPAAVYVTDAEGRITYCNEAAVNLWGARPRLGEDRWCDLARFYYLDGRRMELRDCPTEIALKQGRCVRGCEATLERADGTRIPIIPYPTPIRRATGAIVGVVNMMVDITERQKAERTLAERNAQLALAGRAALVGSYVYDVNKGTSPGGYAVIHGLPDGTTETTISEWRARVHPEDLALAEGLREQAFAAPAEGGQCRVPHSPRHRRGSMDRETRYHFLRIIRELIPFELWGAAELSFTSQGTRCRLEIPGEWASARPIARPAWSWSRGTAGLLPFNEESIMRAIA